MTLAADSCMAADGGMADGPVTGADDLVLSVADEAVTMPLADQARANGRSEQLAKLRPRRK